MIIQIIKRIGLTILISLPFTLLAQGIRFEQGLSWQQIKEKASKEHKYIFVDCYATWCGPCKLMDKQVYTDTTVGSIVNQLFISVKVQMDSTKRDDPFVRRWYTDRRLLENDYKVAAYPTFLFFSPKGKLVHKTIGFQDLIDFLRTAFDATEANRQEYTLLEKFRSKQLPYSEVPGLVSLLEKAGDKIAADDIAKLYIQDYLLKLPDELLMKKENLVIMGRYLKSSDDKTFDLFYKRSSEIDQVLGKEYAEGRVGNIILEEIILPKLWRDDTDKEPIVLKPDWQSIGKIVKERYNDYYADFLIPFEQIAFYRKTKQWPELIDAYVRKIEKEGVGTGDAENNTNDILYYVIFMHGTDEKTLEKAINWAKAIVGDNPGEPDYIDTYANLLYKAGQKKEAIKWEEQAVHVKQKQLLELEKQLQNSEPNQEFLQSKVQETDAMKAVLQKMKADKPTWFKE